MRQRKKKKLPTLRIVLLVIVFFAIIGTVLLVTLQKGALGSRRYQEFAGAELPVITMMYAEGYETELHGYSEEMSLSNMRDTIVPLTDERALKVRISSFGEKIQDLRYAVRSLNQADYVDNGTVEKFTTDGTDYYANFTFSALLESGTEYQLILELDCGGRTTYFYTRILFAKTNYAKELLDFTKEFSESTYDREKASFIINYISPQEDSQTTDYSYVDIHSKYAMFTYGDLKVERGNEVIARVTELEPTQLVVTYEYEISIDEGSSVYHYEVEEYFCVRYRSEKVYLLDYFRKLTQVFDPDRATSEKGRILLGINDGSVQVLNSEDHVYTAFVVNRELWSYNSKTNAMNLIFSFADEEDDSNRSTYSHHDVQVVNVNDNGSMDYMVYGYMNRGNYEGRVGICFYRYTKETNSTKLLFFMPVKQSEQLLMMDIGTLAYVNESDVCYLRYGNGIYSIDLNSGESVEVSIQVYPGMYAKNDRGNVVAWQEGDDLKYPERVVILNMDSQTTAIVKAPVGEYIKILDFIGDDIIYGFGEPSDSIIEANMDMKQLMNHLEIASTDDGLIIQKEYDTTDSYITDAVVQDTRIVISRVLKFGKTYTDYDEDYLLLTQDTISDSDKSALMSRQSRDLKKEYYIQIGRTTNTDSELSIVMPGFDNGSDVNVLDLTMQQTEVYYVYGQGRLLYVESELNKAIAEAYDVFGVVVDADMQYLWTRGTRDLIKNLSFQKFLSGEHETSLTASLRIVVAQEGLQLFGLTEKMENGISPIEILDDALGAGSAINLYGCSLQQVLYFINEGRPVLAVTSDTGGKVIVGYDTDSVFIFDPETGETEKMTVKAASAMFEERNNTFISYR